MILLKTLQNISGNQNLDLSLSSLHTPHAPHASCPAGMEIDAQTAARGKYDINL